MELEEDSEYDVERNYDTGIEVVSRIISKWTQPTIPLPITMSGFHMSGNTFIVTEEIYRGPIRGSQGRS
jgi:hypothetical protein